jgi:hypothetical protein
MEKRRREQLRRQKQQDKERRRVERESQRRSTDRETGPGKDADLEGLVPGPQPGQIIETPSD